MGEEADNASVDYKGKKKKGLEVPKEDTKKNHMRERLTRDRRQCRCAQAS